MPKPYQPFKLSEARFIQASFLTLTDKQIGEKLGRTAASIQNFRKRNGWRKPKGFATGHKPWNTGKPVRLNPAGEFRKGNTPPNSKQEGAISVMAVSSGRYYHIKLNGEWVRLHRHMWQQAHGPIPAGYIVTFRNGDTLDCRMDNLECISRGEAIQRRSNRPKAGESMRKLWQKVQILEANGRPHHYKFRSKYSKTKNAA